MSKEQKLADLKDRYDRIHGMIIQEYEQLHPSGRIIYALQERRRELGIAIRDLMYPSTVPAGRRDSKPGQ